MINQFRSSQKDSSCLKSSQGSSETDPNNCQVVKYNNFTMSDNNNCSNGNKLSNDVNNQSGKSPDELKISQQALTNSKFAKSANILLQTLNCTNTSMNDGDRLQHGHGNNERMNMGYSNINTGMNMNSSNVRSNSSRSTSIGSSRSSNNNRNQFNGKNTESFIILGQSNVSQDDDMNWLEQALTNPQLATSAKFLLQTTNYINNCINSAENELGNVNVMNSTGESMNMSQFQMQNQPQGERHQENFTPNPSSMNCSSFPQISRDNPPVAVSNQVMMSPGRQGAGSVLSTSSQSSHQAGIAYQQGDGFNNMMFASKNRPPQDARSILSTSSQSPHQAGNADQRGNGFNSGMFASNKMHPRQNNNSQQQQLLFQQPQYQFNQQQHLTPLHGANNSFRQHQTGQQQQFIKFQAGNRLQQQQFAYPTGQSKPPQQLMNITFNQHHQLINRTADVQQQTHQYQQQQLVNQTGNQNQPHEFMNQASNLQRQQQQFINQTTANLFRQNQNQGLNNLTESCSFGCFGDGKQKARQVGAQNQSTPASDDDLNNIEPADYREEVSDDLDLSFLLDDDIADGGASNTNSQSDGSSSTTASQSRMAPAPALNTTSPRSTPVESQPGSSQQMQEHLREMTKQHMRDFQKTHVNHRNKKQKKTDKTDDKVNSTYTGRSATNAQAASVEQPTGFTNANLEMGSNATNIVESVAHDASRQINSQCELSQKNITSSTSQGSYQYLSSVGGGMKRKQDASTSAPSTRMSEMKILYEYVESMLSSRGYSLMKLHAKKVGYITEPSPLQKASFGFAVCSSIKKGGASRLSALLASGLSPNPVNKFGDSPFFLACKRGLPELIKTFLDHGADVRVADGFGRTALHYVAWSNDPCFASAKLLLNADARLICVMDNHGNTPLDFVGDSNRLKWLEFLEDSKDLYWKPVQTDTQYAPISKNGDLLPDPPNALTVELAEKVAAGHVLPHEARQQQNNQTSRKT